MRKVLIFLFFFFLFHLLFLSVVLAQEKFTTDYDVSYSVDSNSQTLVNFRVTLTNLTEQYYASTYNIQVGFNDVKNIAASDSVGSITPEVTKNVKGNNIKLTFNKPVVGIGNKLIFNLSFETLEVAQNLGSVWEINIPGLSSQNDFSSFNVSVTYPSFLGRPAFLKPDLSSQINKSLGNKLNFTKSDLGTSGISLGFGEFQIYDFNLTYHLENRNLFPVRTEIALPPSTTYQEVIVDNLLPKPKNVRVDLDGNWLAEYELKASEKVNVAAIGKVKVYLNPKKEKVSEGELADYLKEKSYWQVSNPQIKSLASQLKTPYAIYKYTVENLTYDFSRVTSQKPRAGALDVLRQPSSAVCLEFTDLFVALARGAGIAAREIDGFANTKNTQQRPLSLVKDVLHAWPQYYDKEKQTWVMVDPTWGNTSGVDYFDILDFDHVAFAIKGLDSSYPVPAGGYKQSKDLSAKDVNVTVGKGFKPQSLAKATFDIPQKVFPGFPIKGTLKIENRGNDLLKNQSIKIKTGFLETETNDIRISKIPPFGFIEVPVEFKRTSFLTNKEDTITILHEKEMYKQNILVSPFLIRENLGLFGGGLFVFAFIILSIAAARSGRLPIFRR